MLIKIIATLPNPTVKVIKTITVRRKRSISIMSQTLKTITTVTVTNQFLLKIILRMTEI